MNRFSLFLMALLSTALLVTPVEAKSKDKSDKECKKNCEKKCKEDCKAGQSTSGDAAGGEAE